ncbi:SEL1-like repeat protein [Neisseria chenwenguii]|uniref:Uncharacterized protein n=1 Tax=Neisseria chenwenguii TaxID=1853278 RepID=A0A220S1G8_9NEIS|nr:sel1 repeat family protein [Neisseria chenwenguii]ASK27350.1 hypothetical protein BG910_05995 [Neisseria chenwenguii]ROV56976.1 sel1 repeat family protein [Neisseria chenwenguii]
MKKFLTALAVLLPLDAPADGAFDEQAYNQAAQMCAQNDLESCVQYGIWTRDVLDNPESALAPLQKACDGGNMKGCNILANLYADGHTAAGKDYRRAEALYRRSCDGGYGNACINLKRLKAEMPSEQQIEREQVLSSLQNDCAQEDMTACEALARETAQI